MSHGFSISIAKTKYKVFSVVSLSTTAVLFVPIFELRETDAFWGGMVFVAICLAIGGVTLLQSFGRNYIRIDKHGVLLPGLKPTIPYTEIIKIWSYINNHSGWSLLGFAYNAIFGETLILVFELRRPALLKNPINFIFWENNMYEVSAGRADDLELELEDLYKAIHEYSLGSVDIPIPQKWNLSTT